jgi:Domain of unknown function (DUF4129)
VGVGLTARRAGLVALAVLAILLIAVGIGAAPSVAPGGSRAAPQAVSAAMSSILALLFAIAVFVVGALVWTILREAGRRRGAGVDQPRARERRVIYFVLVELGVLVVFGLVVYFSPRGHGSRPAQAAGVAKLGVPKPTGNPVPFSWAYGGGTLGVIALVAAVVVVASLLRHRARRGGRAPDWDELALSEHPDVLDGIRQIAGGLSAIRIADPSEEPDPRRAVMAAWLAMVDALGRAVGPRSPGEAPQEYVRAVLVGGGVHEAAASRLTDMFEVARWSTRPVGEPMRAEAMRALDEVRAELRRAS